MSSQRTMEEIETNKNHEITLKSTGLDVVHVRKYPLFQSHAGNLNLCAQYP